MQATIQCSSNPVPFQIALLSERVVRWRDNKEVRIVYVKCVS